MHNSLSAVGYGLLTPNILVSNALCHGNRMRSTQPGHEARVDASIVVRP